MTTLSHQLASYAASLRYEDIPAEVVHQAKRFIIDTLGCGFGGYSSDTAQIARDLAATVTASNPSATIFYGGQKTSVDLAAFANEVAIRYLDFNDGYISRGSGHPSGSIAAVLAAAEVMKSSGRDVILATIICYEVFCRFCDAWDNKPLGVDHATIGGIATAAGVGRLFGLTEQQLTDAISITTGINIAVNQPRVGSVSMWKACGYANANRNAIFAVQLAARGLTGAPQVFEGRDGFFNVVSRQPIELGAFGGKGEPFSIMKCHLKRFPLGNFSQTVVTACLDAHSRIDRIEDVTGVEIKTSQKALNIMADVPQKWRPPNRETADHSMPYTAGIALMYGSVDDQYFEERYFLHNKKLLDFIQQIKCTVMESGDGGESGINACEVVVALRSGESRVVKVEYHRGHWRNPMSDAEIEGKFRSLAGSMFSDEQRNAMLETLWTIEDLADIKPLIDEMQRS